MNNHCMLCSSAYPPNPLALAIGASHLLHRSIQGAARRDMRIEQSPVKQEPFGEFSEFPFDLRVSRVFELLERGVGEKRG